MRKDNAQYEAPGMMTYEDFVIKWEEREHEVRTEIYQLRKSLDEKIETQRKVMKLQDRTIHDQQAIILRIREIPVIGKYLVKWATREVSLR